MARQAALFGLHGRGSGPHHQNDMIRDQNSRAWQQTCSARVGIESTISQAVRGLDLRHARYRGLAKTHLQNVPTGIAININRLGDHYAPRPMPPRRPTRIHEL